MQADTNRLFSHDSASRGCGSRSRGRIPRRVADELARVAVQADDGEEGEVDRVQEGEGDDHAAADELGAHVRRDQQRADQADNARLATDISHVSHNGRWMLLRVEDVPDDEEPR